MAAGYEICHMRMEGRGDLDPVVQTQAVVCRGKEGKRDTLRV